MLEFHVTIPARLSSGDIAYIDRTANEGGMSIEDRISDLLVTAISIEEATNIHGSQKLTVESSEFNGTPFDVAASPQ